MVLVACDGRTISEDIQVLQNAGLELQRIGYGEKYQYVTKPEQPDWDKFHKAKKRMKMPMRQIEDEFASAQKYYESDNAVFEKNVKTGRFKKAFIAASDCPDRVGRYLYVEEMQKASAKHRKKLIAESQATIEDIDDELDRIKSKEKRSSELDRKQVQRKIAQAVIDDKNMQRLPVKPSSVDKILVNFLLLECLPYQQKSVVQKLLKLPMLSDCQTLDRFKECLHLLSPVHVTYLVRKILLEKYSSCLPETPGGYAFRLMAESLGTIPITDIERQQAKDADKRRLNVSKAIGVLKEMRKELSTKQRSKSKK
jgi:hypothetical protein